MWQWCTVFCALCALKRTDEQAKIKVSTQSGRMTLTINENDDVCVNMGEPDFEPQNVPFRAVKAEKTYIIRAQERTVFAGVVSMGNPIVLYKSIMYRPLKWKF